MDKFFNNYNFKARFVPVIIMCAPVLWSAIVCIPEVRTVSGVSVLLIVLLSVSSLLCVVSRRSANTAVNHVYKKLRPTTDLLLSSNKYINEETRKRYINRLSSYCDLKIDTAENCNSAIDWLRANYHQSTRAALTDEENATYGFCLTLYAIKIPALCVCIFNLLLLSLAYRFAYITFPTFIICGLFVLICIILWLFYVTKGLVQFAGRKYAIALLSCLDCLDKNGSNALSNQ